MFLLFIFFVSLNNLFCADNEVSFVNSLEQFHTIPSISKDAFEYLKKVNESDEKVRFVFVRHGQTLANTISGLPGSRTSNDPLTELGQRQAVEVGIALKDTGMVFDEYYLSPTLRTKETLDYVQTQLGNANTPIQDERLHEKNHGRYEQYSQLAEDEIESLKKENLALKEKEIRENTGPAKIFQEKFSYSPDPAEIESLAEIYQRVDHFLQEIYNASKQTGKQLPHNYLVISHYGVLKMLFMQDAFNRGFDVDYRAHDIKNCGVVVIEMDEKGFQVKATHGLTFKE